jgi:hypothetical protein
MGSLFHRARVYLNAMSWSYLLGLAFFLFCTGFVLTVGAARHSTRGALFPIIVKLIACLILAKVIAGGYPGFARARAAAARGEGWAGRIRALLPVLLLAWPRMDAANLRACGKWLARRPHPARPPGTAFGFLDKSAYSTWLMMGLVTTFVDLPVNGLLISVMVHDPVIALRVHLICAALALYALVWMLGDHWQMKGSAHVLGPLTLELKSGSRLAASIPRSAIVGCALMGGNAAAWRKRHAVPAHDTLTSTPADEPNLVLALDPQAGVMLTHWQVSRAAPRYLFLYLDQPAQLVAALGAPPLTVDHTR